MRGLVRLAVVGFTVASLLLVGVVGVSATSTSGKAQTTNAFNSAVSAVSGHFDQTGNQNSSTGTTLTNKAKENKDKDKDKGDHKCKPPKHEDATGGHEHHGCGGDTDHDSD
jgi:hypothetical protein